MKALFFMLFVVSFSYAQEITVNRQTAKYEYQQAVKITKSNEQIEKYLHRLAYTNITIADNEISATGSYSDSAAGFIIKIEYMLFLENSNMILTNFTVIDQNHLSANLENVPYTKKRWVKSVNNQLPIIIKGLQSGI